jgi:hypothetical protein
MNFPTQENAWNFLRPRQKYACLCDLSGFDPIF